MALAESVLNILLWLWFILLAFALGCLGLRLLRVRDRGLSKFVFALGLGFGLLSYLSFALGMLGWWTTPIIVGVLALLTAVGVFQVAPLVRAARSLPERWRQTDGFHKWVALCIACLVLLNLVASLAPPSHADSLRGYLATPKAWLGRHRLYFAPVLGWQYPYASPVLYALALSLGRDALPAMLQLGFGVVTVVALYDLGRRYLSPRTGLIAGLFFCAAPAAIVHASDAKIELALAFYALFALSALLRWSESDGRGWLFLSAIFAALMAGNKLYGLFPLPVLSALAGLIALRWRSGRIVDALHVAIFWGMMVALFALPWYWLPLSSTGNPFWPFQLTKLLAGKSQTAILTDRPVVKVLGTGLGAFLKGFWTLTVESRGGDVRIPWPPEFLVFVPALPFVWPGHDRRAQWVLGSALAIVSVFYTSWFLTYQYQPYLFLLFPLLCLLSGWVVDRLLQRDRLAQTVAGVGLVVALIIGLGYATLNTLKSVPVVVGLETREQFLRDNVAFYEDIEWINSQLPADSHLFIMHLNAWFYIEQKYTVGFPEWQTYVDYRHLVDVDCWLKELQALGVTHIVKLSDDAYKTMADGERIRELDKQGRERGRWEIVYHNPEAKMIRSRTFGIARAYDLLVYKVNHPSQFPADCR